MGWLKELLDDSIEIIGPKPEREYLYEDLLMFCAPATLAHIGRGYLGLGMAKYK